MHTTSGWLTKLQLVGGGFGGTTVPSRMSPLLPRSVSSLRVEGAPAEVRRILLVRLPGRPSPGGAAVIDALTSTA
ncbi:hypothetical protein AB0939_09040 [Streptomyces sp. NPDC006990]|uniref:hypothetical protein n=1 Tax=unclassified Streptomyces TaxID=2593676 RepID=UPI003455FAF9